MRLKVSPSRRTVTPSGTSTDPECRAAGRRAFGGRDDDGRIAVEEAARALTLLSPPPPASQATGERREAARADAKVRREEVGGRMVACVTAD